MNVERHGNQYVFGWPEESVIIVADQLRENREHDLVAVVRAGHQFGDKTRWITRPTKLNLSSGTTCESFARTVAKLFPFPDDSPFAWSAAIEAAASRVLEEWGRGEPTIDLGLAEYDENEEQHYLIRPFLPDHEITIVYGDGSSGKSLFAMALAASVRTGHRLPHSSVPRRQGSVLYLDWETEGKTQQRRFRALLRGMNMDAPSNVYYRRMIRGIVAEADALRADVERLGIELVVIDSLGWACGGDANEQGVAVAAMTAIRSLNVTALVIAHHSKGERLNEGRRSIFGSSFFEFAARSAWEVRAEQVDGGIRQQIYHRKSNNDQLHTYPFGNAILFGDRMITFGGYEPSTTEASGASLPALIRRALARSRRPVTAIELASELDQKPDSVKRTLNRLANQGEVSKLPPEGAGEARYGLAAGAEPPPRAAARPSVETEECIRCRRQMPPHSVTPDGDWLCISCSD
jgi:hypothetical protein